MRILQLGILTCRVIFLHRVSFSLLINATELQRFIIVQRITRYPLLIKQILHYTEAGPEREANRESYDMAEKLLEHMNEAIRDQENQELLRKISQNLWIGQG